MSQNNERYWRGKARQVALLVNGFWCLHVFMPLFVILNLIGAAVLLYLRSREMVLQPFWSIYGVLVLCFTIVAYVRSRRRMFSHEDGLVRIDEFLGMHCRLPSASSGQVDWPEARPVTGMSFYYRPGSLVFPFVLSLTFLLAGFWLPVKTLKASSPKLVPQEPLAWSQVDSWIDALEETDMVQEQAVEQFNEKLENLRSQPSQSWYEQSSLEAGEALKDQSAHAIRSLFRNLQSTASALEALSRLGEEASPESLKQLQDRLQETISNLELGNLPLNRELVEQLKSSDSGNMPNLTREQLDNLQQRMNSGMAPFAKELGLDPLKLQPMPMPPGGARPWGDGEIQRGPGPAPLAFNSESNLPEVTNLEGVSNTDLSRATFGDVQKVTLSSEEVETVEYEGLQNSASTEYTGQGGEAVWRNNLTPDEREILQDYFK